MSRAKASISAGRERVATTHARLEARRPTDPLVDVVFSTAERDVQRAGGLLAGALAYRLFFWLLPFVLLIVGGLGFLAAADETAPRELARSAGVFGIAAQSIARAGEDAPRARILAVAVGLPALYLASVALIKALMVTHALIWGVPLRKLERKVVGAFALTGVLTLIVVLIVAESAVRSRSPGLGLVAMLAFLFTLLALWLFVSHQMPRPVGTTWRDLIPGALATAVGAQLVHLVTVYYVSRKVAGASSTYGAIGAAAGVLLSLFFIARVVIAGAALNAELWHRRQPGRREPAAPVDVSRAASPSGSREPLRGIPGDLRWSPLRHVISGPARAYGTWIGRGRWTCRVG